MSRGIPSRLFIVGVSLFLALRFLYVGVAAIIVMALACYFPLLAIIFTISLVAVIAIVVGRHRFSHFARR